MRFCMTLALFMLSSSYSLAMETFSQDESFEMVELEDSPALTVAQAALFMCEKKIKPFNNKMIFLYMLIGAIAFSVILDTPASLMLIFSCILEHDSIFNINNKHCIAPISVLAISALPWLLLVCSPLLFMAGNHYVAAQHQEVDLKINAFKGVCGDNQVCSREQVKIILPYLFEDKKHLKILDLDQVLAIAEENWPQFEMLSNQRNFSSAIEALTERLIVWLKMSTEEKNILLKDDKNEWLLTHKEARIFLKEKELKNERIVSIQSKTELDDIIISLEFDENSI